MDLSELQLHRCQMTSFYSSACRRVKTKAHLMGSAPLECMLISRVACCDPAAAVQLPRGAIDSEHHDRRITRTATTVTVIVVVVVIVIVMVDVHVYQCMQLQLQQGGGRSSTSTSTSTVVPLPLQQ
jgi:hypothetical protein